tara:strand:- start:6300 stop:7478 length:1179 start_codon:yes stop_codon:yes gene_type:complete
MKKFPFNNKKLLLLGSGELGKEFLIEAQRLGCHTIAVDKYDGAPAMHLADESFVIEMNNKEELKNLVANLKPDLIIPEIESLSIEALKELEEEGFKIVPNARTVEITMNRDKIRDLASSELKIRTAKYKYVFNKEELKSNVSELGFPFLIKPLMSSSGKGQNIVHNADSLNNAWEIALQGARGNVKGVILEEYIDFDYEFTLLTVRTNDNKNIYCLPIGHEQLNGDYQCSWQPLNIESSLFEKAKQITKTILDNLNGAGIYGVEFFVKGKELIFSELSPRPHDTGLVTILSQNINEFELHLRAILDLPIPLVEIVRPSASKVILSKGDYENFTYEGISEALEIENSKILIFGKPYARKGRRMAVAISSSKNLEEAKLKANQCAGRVRIISLN